MPAPFVALGVFGFAMSTVSGAAPTTTKGNRSYQSLSDAITAMRYAVAESELGATAANTANNVRMSFTSDELQLKSIAQEKGWNLKWGLHSVGYGANQTIVPAGELRTNGNRVELVRSGQNLTEWFVNNPAGLEHGFTVAAPPGTKTDRGALRLVIKVKGDLTARADQDGQALTLTSARGEHVLRYEKLKIWDANGQTLVARMRTSGSGGEVWLEVENEAAVYPLTIDPTFTLQQKLTASDAISLGDSVAISGDTAVVGDSGVTGAVYIFVRSGTTWSEQQKLTASDGTANDSFGTGVANSGDTAILLGLLLMLSALTPIKARHIYLPEAGQRGLSSRS